MYIVGCEKYCLASFVLTPFISQFTSYARYTRVRWKHRWNHYHSCEINRVRTNDVRTVFLTSHARDTVKIYMPKRQVVGTTLEVGTKPVPTSRY
jgi:hypothetical protein